MNILLLGSGGREHAIAWKISQSSRVSSLYVAPGNAGTSALAENIVIALNDFEGIASLVREKQIDMLIVGPEDPLVQGVRDFFESKSEFKDLMIIGPGKDGAEMEGSKNFAKAFMHRHNIPSAGYLTINKDNYSEGVEFLKTLEPPYVLKADGLAGGKGVLILNDLKEAEEELHNMLNGKFGNAGNQVLIEEFLKGIEISVFVITDGDNYKILGSAKDYKRIGENDKGLNTGGMGAVSPVPFADVEFNKKVEDRIIRPTVDGFKKDGIDYKGFIFFGLMNDNGNPKVIEYNVRMGDPETEVVMPRIKSDVVDLFEATAKGSLDKVDFEMDSRYCTTVMLVSGGYPEKYIKGKEIMGCEDVKDSLVFHAGTKFGHNKELLTNGGRVISVSSFGDSMQEALKLSYVSVSKISFEDMNYRKDIGQDLLKYTS